MLTVFLLPATLGAASLPHLDWLEQGRVDWSSGYVIGYGTGKAGMNVTDRNRIRRDGMKAAFRDATRDLYRLCLDLRVDHFTYVRDYFQADPELQEAFRIKLQKSSPWEVAFGVGDEVRVALKLPLGGVGGLMEFLGKKGVTFENGEGRPSAGPLLPARGEQERISGLVLLTSAGDLAPALRPRIRNREGAILLDHTIASEDLLARPAFLPYYSSVEEALEDPLLGSDPLVAPAISSPGSDTDIVLPAVLEESLLTTEDGMSILREGRITIVLRP